MGDATTAYIWLDFCDSRGVTHKGTVQAELKGDEIFWHLYRPLQLLLQQEDTATRSKSASSWRVNSRSTCPPLVGSLAITSDDLSVPLIIIMRQSRMFAQSMQPPHMVSSGCSFTGSRTRGNRWTKL
eukprot:4652258-Amphidinium_carterae.2